VCIQSIEFSFDSVLMAKHGALLRSSDILIATYPKCGTTWTEQIVLLLLNDCDASMMHPERENDYDPNTRCGKIWVELGVESPLLESLEATKGKGKGKDKDKDKDKGKGKGKCKDFGKLSMAEFESVPAPRVLKTHCQLKDGQLGGHPEGLLPQGMKIVVCSRNIKDCCASAYHHEITLHDYKQDFSTFLRAFLEKGLGPHLTDDSLYCDNALMPGRFLPWFAGWWAAKQGELNAEMLWISYENMKADPVAEIQAIADHLGIACDTAKATKVAELSSFDAMRTAVAPYGVEGFFRSGKVGGWQDMFSKEDTEWWDVECAKKAAELGDAVPAQCLG